MSEDTHDKQPLVEQPMSESPRASADDNNVNLHLQQDKALNLDEKSATASPALTALPPGPTIEDLLKQRSGLFKQEEKTEAWLDAADMVKTYSDEMIRRWNTEIDTYLVYAGLFSAILTAFNVQSYQLLQPAVPDPTVLALQQISLQLRSYSVSPNFVNSTHSALLQTAPDDAATPVPRTAIWLNALWFSSLILSLSAASVGIMVKQWLNEYSSGLSGVSREAARLRQYRLNTLVKWHVAEIVIVIPILLQLALALFLAGLLVLLWTLHPAVAITASVLVGALAVFTLGTALLPLFNHSCAYLTPQTHLLYSFLQRVVHVVSAVLWRLLGVPAFQYVSFRRRSDSLIYRFLQWIAWNFVEREAVTWRGREQSAVKWSGHELDVDMLITAHGTTLHPDARAAATVCLVDCPPRHVVEYFRRIQDSLVRIFGESSTARFTDARTDMLLFTQVALCTLDEAVDMAEKAAFEAIRPQVLSSLSASNPHTGAGQANWLLFSISSLIRYLEEAEPDQEMLVHRLYDTRALFVEWCREHGTKLSGTALSFAVVQRRRRIADRYAPPVTGSIGPRGRVTEYWEALDDFLKVSGYALASPTVQVGELELIRASVRDTLFELNRTLRGWVESPEDLRTRFSMIRYTWIFFRRIYEHLAENSTVFAPLVPPDLASWTLRVVDLLKAHLEENYKKDSQYHHMKDEMTECIRHAQALDDSVSRFRRDSD